MKTTMLILIATVCVLCRAQDGSVVSLVHVGDSTAAVRDALGAPKISFPLQGKLILDYGHCVITSSNGVVVAIKNRATAPATATKQTLPLNVPSVHSVLARAQAGDAESQYCIAYCYQTGNTVDTDMEEAIRWYTLAALQGNMAAQHNLGVIYLKGDGVECDREQAYVWALLAAEHGDESLARTIRPLITDDQETAARLRYARIRNGQEKPPYGISEASAAMAKKSVAGESPTTE